MSESQPSLVEHTHKEEMVPIRDKPLKIENRGDGNKFVSPAAERATKIISKRKLFYLCGAIPR